MNSLILQVSSRLILPVALLFSIYLLLRGHNQPGGGFVGGLVAAAGFIVYALPRGRAALIKLLVIAPESIAGSGLLLALSSGLLSLATGQPFLTHQWMTLSNGFAVGTPLAFDLGVYLAVVGAVLTFLGYYLEL